MDLQLFEEGAAGWDGAVPLLPALSDSGSLHISGLPKAFFPPNSPLPTLVLMLFPGQHPCVLQRPSTGMGNLQPERQRILAWIPPPESHPGHLRHLPCHCQVHRLGFHPWVSPPRPAQPKPTSWLPMSVFTQPG